ncbi:MAG: serine/threonine protein kinase, partial [Nevskiaceae bacterium]|nr:serine/threonine protein kinase [Nevskiaceae bacterium]
MTGAETTRLDSQTAQHEATLRMDARATDGVDDDATMQVDAQTAVFEASAPRSPHSVRRMNLPVGYQLQEYEILQTLGNGGFGITYLARDRNLSKTVAIKEFFPTGLATRYHDDTIGPVSDASNVLTDYSHLLSRFIDEARTLAKFEHPNVVRVLRYVEANNTAYIIMEYIAGPTLAQYIREHGTLDEVELRPMLLALIDGLRVVHEHGMLHRDIKPENVMLRNGREPVLIDFGASREAIGRSIQNITMMCTPGYSPIEQMVSDDNRLGPYSDIYALGATAYTALVGSPPGKASVRVYGNGDPTVPVTQAAKGRASEGFLRAIDWAIEPSQKDRPQTTQQWLTAFNGAVLAPQSSNVKALVVRSDQGEGKRRKVGGGRGVIVGVAVGIGVIGGAVAMLGLAAFAFRSEDKAGQSPVSAAISTVTSWFKPKAPVQEPSEESSQQQSSTPEQSTTPEQTPQVVQVQPSEQDQTQTQPVAPVDPSAQTVAVASSTASPNALPQPATGVCTDPGAAPPAQGTPDFGGVRQVSCQIEGIGLTPSLAIVAALQSAVGQVNGVGVANRLQGLRTALDVDVNGAHVAAIDMRSFSQRVILASQGAITSYDVLSQQQVSNPNKSSYWKTLIRANVAKYAAPDESGRPKIIIAPPRIAAASYVVGDARVPAAEVSRAIAARLSDILTQTRRFIVLDRDFSD